MDTEIVHLLPGGVTLTMDRNEDYISCVEWRIDENGNIHVLDMYELSCV